MIKPASERFTNWLTDLRVTSRGLQVRDTGHYIPLEIGSLIDAWRWLSYDRALKRTARVGDRPIRVCFTPVQARPWYFARSIVDALGAEIVVNPSDADVVWSFEDATQTEEIHSGPGQLSINAQCTDVSKTHVGAIFEKSFGYNLDVDPETFTGSMVEKSEINGAHDGRVVEGPTPRRPGYVYQRLVDNRVYGGMVEDLRTTIVGGKPVLVFRKKRSQDRRFANSNSNVVLAPLDEVFTEQEIHQIENFAQNLRLDAGGVDVLRDGPTGKLFIVDANKTDMGPPLALPLEHKLLATQVMAQALNRYILDNQVMRPTSAPVIRITSNGPVPQGELAEAIH